MGSPRRLAAVLRVIVKVHELGSTFSPLVETRVWYIALSQNGLHQLHQRSKSQASQNYHHPIQPIPLPAPTKTPPFCDIAVVVCARSSITTPYTTSGSTSVLFFCWGCWVLQVRVRWRGANGTFPYFVPLACGCTRGQKGPRGRYLIPPTTHPTQHTTR